MATQKFKLLVLLIISIFVFSSIASAANEAKIFYNLDDQGTGVTKIVKGVPFRVKVGMTLTDDSQKPAITTLKLFTKATGSTISGADSHGWLRSGGASSNCNVPSNIFDGLSGTVWKYEVSAACAKTDTSVTANVETLKVTASQTGDVTLDTSQTNVVESNTVKYTVSVGSSFSYTPADSLCGDGVVDTFVGEACDDGNIADVIDGCAKTCKYIDLGWSCSRVANGDRKSACTSMPREQLFVEKMTWLLQKKACYPNDNHPVKAYSWYCDVYPSTHTDAGKLDVSNDVPSNSQIIGAVADALRIYLTSK